MKYVFYFLFLLCLNACTYSVNLVHTQGTATDVVDETQKADPEVTAEIPLMGV